MDGSFALIETSTGKIKWQKKLNSPIFSTPACLQNEGQFLIAEVSGIIHCLDFNGNEVYFNKKIELFFQYNLFQSKFTEMELSNSWKYFFFFRINWKLHFLWMSRQTYLLSKQNHKIIGMEIPTSITNLFNTKINTTGRQESPNCMYNNRLRKFT